MEMIINRHNRCFPYPIEELRPWIERLWSGTDQDAFPRDVLPNFRRNPEGVDPSALLPGVTRMGHGPTRFRFEKWDGHSWEVSVLSSRMSGRHGFVLTPDNGGTRLTHVLELTRYSWAEWTLLIRPIHDWALEALFDRLEQGLATGQVPATTSRPLPLYARLIFRSWVWLRRLGLTRRW